MKFSFKRRGGTYFFAIGRITGSLTIAGRSVAEYRRREVAKRIDANRRAFDREMARLQRIADAPLATQRAITLKRVALNRLAAFIAGAAFSGIAL